MDTKDRKKEAKLEKEEKKTLAKAEKEVEKAAAMHHERELLAAKHPSPIVATTVTPTTTFVPGGSAYVVTVGTPLVTGITTTTGVLPNSKAVELQRQGQQIRAASQSLSHVTDATKTG